MQLEHVKECSGVGDFDLPRGGDKLKQHQNQYAAWLGRLEGAKLPDGSEVKVTKRTVADVLRVEEEPAAT